MRTAMRVAILCAAAAVAGASITAAPAAQQKAAPAKGAPAAKAAAPGHNPGAALKNPIPPSEASVKAGRVVWAKTCRACHGLTGKGDGPTAPPGSHPANLTDAEWKYGGSDGEIFYTIKNGVKPFDVMEPWGKKYTDADIWNTVNFVRDLAKAKAAKK